EPVITSHIGAAVPDLFLLPPAVAETVYLPRISWGAIRKYIVRIALSVQFQLTHILLCILEAEARSRFEVCQMLASHATMQAIKDRRRSLSPRRCRGGR